MMHMSDCRGLAEGDFDYEPDCSFHLTVEKDCKTLCPVQISQSILRKRKSLLVGNINCLNSEDVESSTVAVHVWKWRVRSVSLLGAWGFLF